MNMTRSKYKGEKIPDQAGGRHGRTRARVAREPGLLHALLGADSADLLDAFPKVGASWEGFVIEELIGPAVACGEVIR
jgi:hypothetical protein